MLGEETRDSRILTGPIASQCHNASLCKRLARRIGVDRNALIDLADQAPVGGEVNEHRRACCAQLSQTRLAERLVPRMALVVQLNGARETSTAALPPGTPTVAVDEKNEVTISALRVIDTQASVPLVLGAHAS